MIAHVAVERAPLAAPVNGDRLGLLGSTAIPARSTREMGWGIPAWGIARTNEPPNELDAVKMPL